MLNEMIWSKRIAIIRAVERYNPCTCAAGDRRARLGGNCSSTKVRRSEILAEEDTIKRRACTVCATSEIRKFGLLLSSVGSRMSARVAGGTMLSVFLLMMHRQHVGCGHGLLQCVSTRNEMGGEKSGVKLDKSQDLWCGGQHRLPRPKNRRRGTSEASRRRGLASDVTPDQGWRHSPNVCVRMGITRSPAADGLDQSRCYARGAVCQGVGRGRVVPRWTKA